MTLATVPTPEKPEDTSALKRGWTTGACASAAAAAAFSALQGRGFEDPVSLVLPGGQAPAFALAFEDQGEGWAQAGIIKDAGDDPDITHGALVRSRVRWGEPGSGLVFEAGEGVILMIAQGVVNGTLIPVEGGQVVDVVVFILDLCQDNIVCDGSFDESDAGIIRHVAVFSREQVVNDGDP